MEELSAESESTFAVTAIVAIAPESRLQIQIIWLAPAGYACLHVHMHCASLCVAGFAEVTEVGLPTLSRWPL